MRILAIDTALEACAAACEDAGVDPLGIDAVLFCGITQDFIEPATANVVAEAVGARNARVFDIMNACNGLADGVDVADALIHSGKASRVLVATGERTSVVNNWQARTVEELIQSLAGFMVGDGGGKVPARLFYDVNERQTNTSIPAPSQQPTRNANDPANATDPTGAACKAQ